MFSYTVKNLNYTITLVNSLFLNFNLTPPPDLLCRQLLSVLEIYKKKVAGTKITRRGAGGILTLVVDPIKYTFFCVIPLKRKQNKFMKSVLFIRPEVILHLFKSRKFRKQNIRLYQAGRLQAQDTV